MLSASIRPAAVIDDEVPGVRRQADALAGERAVHLHGVLPGAAVDDVASGPPDDEAVEQALEPVVAVAERDGLLPGARAAAVDEVVACAGLNRDGAGRSGQEVVVAVVPDHRDRDVAVAEVADVADNADEVVAGASAHRDREVADAGAVHAHAVVASTAKHPEPLDLGPVELGIDRAVEAEVHHEAVGVEGDVDHVAGCGSRTVTVPLVSVAVGPVAAPAGVAATSPPAVVAITATIPANRRRFELCVHVLLLCECWCCYYAGTGQLVHPATNPTFDNGDPLGNGSAKALWA